MQAYNLHGLTIPTILRRQAALTPASIALSSHSWRGTRDRLSYAQLTYQMDTMGASLSQRGVQKGDRIAVFLTNYATRGCVLTALGCMVIGAVVVPLNTRSSDEELTHALKLTEPAAIVCMSDQAGRMKSLYAEARLLVLDASAGQEEQWPDPMDASTELGIPQIKTSADDLVCLLFTSGTTARSKAVMHTHRSMLHAGRAVGGAIGLREGDMYQGAWPFFTSSVLSMACMSAWVHGAGVVLEEVPLTNAQRLNLIAMERTTVYHGVTSIIQFLIDEYRNGTYDMRNVRRIVYGGSVMPAEVIQRIADTLPEADQIHIWGMTETGPAGSYLSHEFLPRKAGAIGFPMPSCSVRIIDASGSPVPPGEEGEIAFSGPSMAVGYYKNPEATKETFVDGWVRTGDIGRIDDEGVLHFVDRKKDIINRGGLKISSAAIEDVLYRFAGIAEAAAIAVAHSGLGEDIAVCIVPNSGVKLDLKKLEAHCARHLADYARPRRWYILDSLPKSPMGKVLKRELRDLIPNL